MMQGQDDMQSRPYKSNTQGFPMRRQVKLHNLSVSGAYPGSGLSNNPRRENEYVFGTELELGMCKKQVI